MIATGSSGTQCAILQCHRNTSKPAWNPVLVVDSYREYYGFEESPEAGAVQEVYRKLSELTGIPLSNPDAYDEDGYLTEEVTQFAQSLR